MPVTGIAYALSWICGGKEVEALNTGHLDSSDPERESNIGDHRLPTTPFASGDSPPINGRWYELLSAGPHPQLD